MCLSVHVQCLRLLGGLTAVRSPPDELLPGRLWPSVAPNAAAILLEMQATSMVGVEKRHIVLFKGDVS